MTLTFEPSDILGVVAGIALAFPHFKDQYYRLRREIEEREREKSKWPGLRKAMSHAWESKRLEYDGLDSIILAGGALSLILSFILHASGI